jgi:hypothetical protein
LESIYIFFVKIYIGFVADIDIKILEVPPGAGHAFPRHMRRGRVIYFCQGFFLMYDAIHGWMMGQMDGWVT